MKFLVRKAICTEETKEKVFDKQNEAQEFFDKITGTKGRTEVDCTPDPKCHDSYFKLSIVDDNYKSHWSVEAF